MKRVLQHIKEQKYQNLYLFYGKEKYLAAQTRDKLKEAQIGRASCRERVSSPV